MNERQAKTTVKRWWRRRWIHWAAASLLFLAIAALGIAQYLLRHAEPILRRRVVDTLAARFHGPVQLDELHISVFKGLEVSGKGLRIFYLAGPAAPSATTPQLPMFSIGGFQFHTTLSGLLRPDTRVATVHVQGMRIDIPPRQDRGPILPARSGKRSQPKISLILDQIVCTDTTLIIETDKPGKLPLQFDIAHLTLRDVAADKPFDYDAMLVNPKPLGDIHATGHFGPWQSADPRSTHADGSYSFTHADLDTIKGIGGILSSIGRFTGPLEQLTVDGETDTPDFSLDTANHPVPLHTWFHALVDGTTGDTTLAPVRARLLHSWFTASGTIRKVREAGGPNAQTGHDIQLDVVMDDARIEDMLQLAVKSEPPIMRGGFAMRTKLHIPPGHISVSRKLQLDGNFTITSATFSSPKVQEQVDSLSARARGQAEEAKAHQADRVTSTMTGRFVMGDAQAALSGLRYRLPGAVVTLDGNYAFADQNVNLHGLVRTDARLSQMVTGWKSLLLMAADPFFKKDGAGTQVPIKVTGSKSDLQFGLDFGHAQKTPPQPASPRPAQSRPDASRPK